MNIWPLSPLSNVKYLLGRLRKTDLDEKQLLYVNAASELVESITAQWLKRNPNAIRDAVEDMDVILPPARIKSKTPKRVAKPAPARSGRRAG